MPVTQSEFQYVQSLVRGYAAIVIDAGKEYLVESRLGTLARDEGFETIGRMIESIRNKPINGMHRKVVDAMTTNETSFFRDIHPFEIMRKELFPRIIAKRRTERRLNIWCGAASTGQEPYSVALMLRDYFPELAGWSVRILATDINGEVLARARAGRFRQMEVNRGLPAPMLVKYFRERATMWELADEIRSMVDFREMNLAVPWPQMPKPDLVLLRNVMIYFDVPMKKEILGRIHSILAPDGYLLLGSAETTLNLDERFHREVFGKVVCYRTTPPAPGVAAAAPQAQAGSFHVAPRPTVPLGTPGIYGMPGRRI
jgi:chemotaxis protein methyltransferase CheR